MFKFRVCNGAESDGQENAEADGPFAKTDGLALAFLGKPLLGFGEILRLFLFRWLRLASGRLESACAIRGRLWR